MTGDDRKPGPIEMQVDAECRRQEWRADRRRYQQRPDPTAVEASWMYGVSPSAYDEMVEQWETEVSEC